MRKLSDARMLGGIGSILQIIPFISIVGYILTLVAVKYVPTRSTTAASSQICSTP